MANRKVIVFIPALNEEDSIGKVIAKVPRYSIPNYDVEIIVINDGSTDGTIQAAITAGADDVVSFDHNRGLGAAVRAGLQECYLRGAEIGVMIDADNEYPANEIPQLVAPIISGEADYTMGSRFLGHIDGMRLHRRWGNYFFTALQSILLRCKIYDGQSGMRAFSRQALAHAEIIHDYNYAQVLTLNLVRKGFVMQEVPISYQVRTSGQSFIRFWAYVSAVFPAMLREMVRPVQKQSRQQITSNNAREKSA